MEHFIWLLHFRQEEENENKIHGENDLENKGKESNQNRKGIEK